MTTPSYAPVLGGRKLSPTCEVWTQGREECGKPTTHWYPAMGGGTMALCYEHAQKHLPHGAWEVPRND